MKWFFTLWGRTACPSALPAQQSSAKVLNVLKITCVVPFQYIFKEFETILHEALFPMKTISAVCSSSRKKILYPVLNLLWPLWILKCSVFKQIWFGRGSAITCSFINCLNTLHFVKLHWRNTECHWTHRALILFPDAQYTEWVKSGRHLQWFCPPSFESQNPNLIVCICM